MSRVGNSEIIIPEGVSVTNENYIVTIKGPLGELKLKIDPIITCSVNDNILTFLRSNDER